MKGCDLCPHSEDVWLEAARLQTPEHAKALLARGVSYNQTSVKLWIQVGRALTPFPQGMSLAGVLLPCVDREDSHAWTGNSAVQLSRHIPRNWQKEC